MAENKLTQVKFLALQLTPFEQTQLLEFLAQRIGHAIKSTQPDNAEEAARKKKLEEFQQLSNKIAAEIAANDDPNSETMTQEFLRTRR